MRVAVQSVLWGQNPTGGIATMLHEIKAAGYEGVELWQHPEVVGSARNLFLLLRECRLKLLGVSGGSLSEKTNFLEAIIREEQLANVAGKAAEDWVAYWPGRRLPYVYIDGWDGARAKDAVDNGKGFQVALHPAMFKPVQTAREAEDLLRQHPNLRFLPDTGHLTVAGENLVDVLKSSYDRIVAVHLKDWDESAGRAMQFYSAGFTELGEGDVELGAIMEFLKSQSYKGWLVVDQSSPEKPIESARASRGWLRAEYGV